MLRRANSLASPGGAVVTARDGVGLGIRLWRIDRVLVQSSEKWIVVSSGYRIQQQHQLDISQTAHDMGRGAGRATRCAECLTWGQNRKSSMRAYVFRFAPESGHRAMQSACPFRAIGLNRSR